MSRSRKDNAKIQLVTGGKVHHLKINECHVCGKRFKSRSHYDALCDVCWADNDMKPYVSRTKGYWGTGMMN